MLALTALAVHPAGALAESPTAETPTTETPTAELRAALDAASREYFDALAELEELDARIAATEAELGAAREHADALRGVVRERARDLYVHRGDGVDSVLETDSVVDAARRARMLERAGEADEATVGELADLIDRLEARRDELAGDRAERASALEALRAEQATLDAALDEAEARAEQEAARRAASEAAARAATTTTVTAAEPEPSAATPPAPEPPGPSEPPAPSQPETPAPPPTAGGVHPRHDDPFLVCTRGIESSGNYQAVNPAGPYLGAYQFLQSTWDTAARYAGRSELVGVPPNRASEYDQDDMAWTLYQWQGNRPWGGRC